MLPPKPDASCAESTVIAVADVVRVIGLHQFADMGGPTGEVAEGMAHIEQGMSHLAMATHPNVFWYAF
jgi:hypothetical protein